MQQIPAHKILLPLGLFWFSFALIVMQSGGLPDTINGILVGTGIGLIALPIIKEKAAKLKA